MRLFLKLMLPFEVCDRELNFTSKYAILKERNGDHAPVAQSDRATAS